MMYLVKNTYINFIKAYYCYDESKLCHFYNLKVYLYFYPNDVLQKSQISKSIVIPKHKHDKIIYFEKVYWMKDQFLIMPLEG